MEVARVGKNTMVWQSLARLQAEKPSVIATTQACDPNLASCGVSGEEAIHAARGLRSVAHGFATLEEGGGFGMDVDADESFRRLVRAFVDGLDGGPPSGTRET